MGFWGPGNFNNDGALDYLLELEEQFRTAIEEGLTDPMVVGQCISLPTIEIWLALQEKGILSVPGLKTIHRWRDRFLTVYDEEIDGYTPEPEYKVQRRTVIVDTFARLEAASATQDRDEDEWIDDESDEILGNT